ncbi:SRPBCC family protein [Nocardioides sp. CN2-186]|uniref:SRPBCC family protein n=1 Tax=Nocardioides tweenelious TaxID=3156607 RepID=UPI0032B32AF7
MTTTVSQMSVEASVDAVWDVLAGFADISRWANGVSQSSLLSAGSPGPGAVRRVQVGRSALRETVTTWEPGSRLAYDIAGLPAIVKSASNTWTLEPDARGTSITLTGAIETRGGPLVAKIVAGKVGQANEDLVQDLASHLWRQQR